MLRGGGGLINACANSLGRVNLQLLVCWSALLLLVYCYLIREGQVMQLSEFYSPDSLSTGSSPGSIVSSHHNLPLVDAIVFVSIGRTMSSNPMTDYTIASTRLMGRWTGDIFVLTDCPDCFNTVAEQYGAKVVEVPPAKSLMHIKALKAKMFSYLPESVNGALYLDVDIIVARSLENFLRDVAKLVAKRLLTQGQIQKKKKKPDTKISGDVDSKESAIESLNELLPFAAFPDARGHYVGFCSGCEKWHTGVLIVRRTSQKKPSTCLSSWEQIVLSGKFDTDQESLDATERRGHCSNMMELPSKHLLFAKDYIGMALTSGQTFIHLTGAGHMQDQDYFYRDIIVPRIYSMNSPLQLATESKKCKDVLPNTPRDKEKDKEEVKEKEMEKEKEKEKEKKKGKVVTTKTAKAKTSTKAKKGEVQIDDYSK